MPDTIKLDGHAARRMREVAGVAPADALTPADRYQELFVAVQMSRVFDDSKTFVDCVPRHEPGNILSAYRAGSAAPGFELADFVRTHFTIPGVPKSQYKSEPGQPLIAHIDGLWPVLKRHPLEHPPRCSLLPLAWPYVVPGGRFRELYYWDSYFEMLGLADSGHAALLRDMVDNFAYLLDIYGRIPNGTRSYYLSRSHPPVFALMVKLLEEHEGKPALEYLPQLRREHAFWMEGAEDLRPGEQHRRLVRLDDGALMNRYWDERDQPREEAYVEDVMTARQSPRPAREVYRDLRAAAESGWDFSSRWCGEDGSLPSIRTTSILPVDLNCFLYALEVQIAALSEAGGDADAADDFRHRAAARRANIQRLMWDEAAGAFFDFDWQLDRRRENLTAATVVPLFVGAAEPAQAQRLAATIETQLLDDGGLATTQTVSGEQWDQPNGWAPLQWLAIKGLQHYERPDLAGEIAHRWLATVGRLYRREWKLVEKYVLRGSQCGLQGGGGGEYPLQDGFGWTNGVTRRLLKQHPWHEACHALAGERPR